MKKLEHITRAKEIGADSWELLNYNSLPNSASREHQVVMLIRDQAWLRDHTEEVCRRIDLLIQAIAGGAPTAADTGKEG